MNIYIGADHNGYDAAINLTQALQADGWSVTNLTSKVHDSQDDYPDIAHRVAKQVQSEPDALGILLCGSGGGVCVAANKHQGIYAVSAMTINQAISARHDDHANILCFAAKELSPEQMRELASAFLHATPASGRHQRRFAKVQHIETYGTLVTPPTKPEHHRQISPSILSADLGNLNGEIARLTPYVDRFHVDIMDGHFVPNLTFGLPVLKNIHSTLPLDAHLMVEYPEQYIPEAAKYCERIYLHIESTSRHTIEELIALIRSSGAVPGLTMKPDTDPSLLTSHLSDVEHLLFMTVMPGWSGQSMLTDTLPTLRDIAQMYPHLSLCIDGGVNDQTITYLKDIRIDCVVSGSYLFGNPNPADAVEKLW